MPLQQGVAARGIDVEQFVAHPDLEQAGHRRVANLVGRDDTAGRLDDGLAQGGMDIGRAGRRATCQRDRQRDDQKLGGT